ncbi:MAG TPA: hypothetical protein PKA88_21605 [Polyangiaceae bacterium]|nr:hypothetical protein [Polyangiaceae bacterium]
MKRPKKAFVGVVGRRRRARGFGTGRSFVAGLAGIAASVGAALSGSLGRAGWAESASFRALSSVGTSLESEPIATPVLH